MWKPLLLVALVLPAASKSWDEDKERLLKMFMNQVTSQQLYIGERLRSDGHSGIKQVRLTRSGMRPYNSPTHSQRNVACTHNHGNNIRTVGLGEFIAVMNGEEFRTRHNDYSLVMPSTKNSTLHAVEDIPFPDVPPDVLQYESLEEQIEEMRQWFKAWDDQDYSIRDYREYFKPVLCYLEGAWMYADAVGLDGFDSDRHFIDADGWFDLQKKVRYTSESGRKDPSENYAYLPTRIVQYSNGTATVAQWNYRILCHPLKDDLPLSRLKIVDDLSNRLTYDLTWEEYQTSRGARFQISTEESDGTPVKNGERNFLDTLMEQIPGKDNYPAYHEDDAMGELAYHIEPNEDGEDEILNTGYYHRWFKVSKPGALGRISRARGFSDENLFMAMTSNPEIVPSVYEDCEGHGEDKVCTSLEQRWTYAFPLEVNYLTPLNNWNFYNIQYKGDADSAEGKTVTADGRNGGLTEEEAYNGTNSKVYYMTPPEFHDGDEEAGDPADTTSAIAGVLDSNGNMKTLRASGMRVFLPSIPGLGELRLRYQIMPIHGEGQTVMKELEALKDIVLNPMEFNWALRTGNREQTNKGLTLRLEANPDLEAYNHTHLVYLRADDIATLKLGKNVWINSEEDTEGRTHRLKMKHKKRPEDVDEYRYMEIMPYETHPRVLTILDDE